MALDALGYDFIINPHFENAALPGYEARGDRQIAMQRVGRLLCPLFVASWLAIGDRDVVHGFSAFILNTRRYGSWRCANEGSCSAIIR